MDNGASSYRRFREEADPSGLEEIIGTDLFFILIAL